MKRRLHSSLHPELSHPASLLSGRSVPLVVPVFATPVEFLGPVELGQVKLVLHNSWKGRGPSRSPNDEGNQNGW